MNKPHRRSADHEAESVSIQADSVSKPKKFYRNAKHNGNRSKVEGNIEITIRRRHKESKDDDFRPYEKTVLTGGPKQSIIVEAKRIEHQGRHDGKDVASASKDVRIFGRLFRRRKP